VAEKMKTATPFLNAHAAKDLVHSVYPEADEHRVNDVAKMLNVIAKDLRLNASLSDETKEYIKRKNEQQKRKPLAFVQK
jgi:hypothetical protein